MKTRKHNNHWNGRLPTLLIFLSLSFNACKEAPVDFYFECFINGEKYAPSYYRDNVQADVTGDSLLMITANQGYQSLGLALFSRPVIAKSFILKENLPYSNNSTGIFSFGGLHEIRSFHPGIAIISSLDKGAKTIKGTFSFTAYNFDNTDSVVITRGKFWIPYRSF